MEKLPTITTYKKALEYCSRLKISAFALNPKKFEIFVIEQQPPDDDHPDGLIISWCRDDSGDENCSSATGDFLYPEEAEEAFPYVNNLIFCFFDGYNGTDNNYFYASKELIGLNKQFITKNNGINA